MRSEWNTVAYVIEGAHIHAQPYLGARYGLSFSRASVERATGNTEALRRALYREQP